MLRIEIFPKKDWEQIEDFPWTKEIETWEGYRFVERRKGESRHTLFFLRTDKGDVVIKRTSSESAEKEYYTYNKLISMGIPTIMPIGFAKKHKDGVEEGYLLTLYEKGSLPESHLMRLLKSEQYRDLVWNSIIALLVVMHLKGIFWGDPSLDNILVKFYKTKVEALLVDTETVQLYDYISEEKEKEDLERMFESLFAYSFVNDEFDERLFEKRKQYIEKRYNKLKKILNDELNIEKEDYFKLVKRVDDLFLLGYTVKPEGFSPKLKVMFKPVTPRKGWFVQMLEDMLGVSFTPEQSKKIFKEILQYRYRMSKSRKTEMKLGDAARDWYQHRFLPARRVFKQYFPDENPVKIYLEILTHKWFLSEKAGKGVGIVEAAKDYSRRFGKTENDSLWQSIIKLFSEVFKNK